MPSSSTPCTHGPSSTGSSGRSDHMKHSEAEIEDAARRFERLADNLDPADRYASVVDVHVILRRAGKLLLLRRAGNTWASGQLCRRDTSRTARASSRSPSAKPAKRPASSSTRPRSGWPCPSTTGTPAPPAPASASRSSRPRAGTVNRPTPSRTSTPSSSGPAQATCRRTPWTTPPPSSPPSSAARRSPSTAGDPQRLTKK